jgi:hypothetical protein
MNETEKQANLDQMIAIGQHIEHLERKVTILQKTIELWLHTLDVPEHDLTLPLDDTV